MVVSFGRIAAPHMFKTAILLTFSNVFMTIAWYGHLRYGKTLSLWAVILISWGIAFFEYCFQVPANRIGYRAGYSATGLKITQEAITLVVFCIFAHMYLDQKMQWNHYVGIALVGLAVFFVFYQW